MIKSSFPLIVALTVPAWVQATTYSNVASLSGYSFLNAFQWQSIADPTHGRVNYVDARTAWNQGLVWVTTDNVVGLKGDNTNYLDPNGSGRNSFRLQSRNQYSEHVAIFDIIHMPEGCGTWPAISFDQGSFDTVTIRYSPTQLLFHSAIYREVGGNWPYEGEIDIVEGVNNQSPNQATLHTSSGCTQLGSRWQTGSSTGGDCHASVNNNAGCGVRFADGNSFGPPFNNAGGGWYAVARSSTDIKIFFWERSDSNVPSEVRYPGDSVTPDNWGEPAAYFYDTHCDFSSHFGSMNIIINLDFCGDWAGGAYASSGCPSTCVDYVNNNPTAFVNAYFEFKSLNIYT